MVTLAESLALFREQMARLRESSQEVYLRAFLLAKSVCELKENMKSCCKR